MKRKLCCLLAIVLLLCLAACNGQPKDEVSDNTASDAADTAVIDEEGVTTSKEDEEAAPEPAVLDETEHGKVLIAYFTWAENAADTGNVDAVSSASVLPPGNVAQMASWIQQEIGGDLFSIQVEEPYSSDYDACLERAADEKAENARPALKERLESIAEYDTIFIGYPNWWYSAPMPVFSFLEEYDFAGKTVVLFCSHGTGGLASSVQDISAALPDSAIESNVLGVYREEVQESQESIRNWLNEIGY